jgi:hypothetical protein
MSIHTSTNRAHADHSNGPAHSIERMSCLDQPDLFQDPLLEEPPSSTAPSAVRRRYSALESKAQEMCHSCPLLTDCLYRAVVEHNVSGIAGGTTERQRTEIRKRLRWTVQPEDFDTLAGVTGRHRQVDHDEVVRLRHANPHESLETLAQRLGCSLSTVKRHLRRARTEPRRPQKTRTAPTISAVLAAYGAVINRLRAVA